MDDYEEPEGGFGGYEMVSSMLIYLLPREVLVDTLQTLFAIADKKEREDIMMTIFTGKHPDIDYDDVQREYDRLVGAVDESEENDDFIRGFFEFLNNLPETDEEDGI